MTLLLGSSKIKVINAYTYSAVKQNAISNNFTFICIILCLKKIVGILMITSKHYLRKFLKQS